MDFFTENTSVKVIARKFNDVYIHSFTKDNHFITLEANKVILATFSKYFESLFETRNFQSFVDIIITETSYEIMKLILEMMYDGRVHVRHEFCSDFKKAILKFKISTSNDSQQRPAQKTFVLNQTIVFPEDKYKESPEQNQQNQQKQQQSQQYHLHASFDNQGQGIEKDLEKETSDSEKQKILDDLRERSKDFVKPRGGNDRKQKKDNLLKESLH